MNDHEPLVAALEKVWPALPLHTAQYNSELLRYPTNYPVASCKGETAFGVTGEDMGAYLAAAANSVPALLAERAKLLAVVEAALQEHGRADNEPDCPTCVALRAMEGDPNAKQG